MNPAQALMHLIGPAGIACGVIAAVGILQIIDTEMRPGSLALFELKNDIHNFLREASYMKAKPIFRWLLKWALVAAILAAFVGLMIVGSYIDRLK